MFAKSFSFFSAAFLFAALTTCAVPAKAQSPAPAAPTDLNAKAHAVLDKGIGLNSLTGKDMQPYHMKATYEIYEGDPTPEAGTLEVWATAPDQWKRTYSGKKYSGTEWSVSPSEKFQAKPGPKENFDHAKLDMRVGVPTTNPLFQAKNVKPDYEMDGRIVASPIAMTCTLVVNPARYAGDQNPNDLFPMYCFDNDSYLRLATTPETTIQLNDIQMFQNRAVAKDVKVIFNKHIVAAIKVTLLEPLSPADTAAVKPAGNAIPQPYTRIPGDPKLVVVKQGGAAYPMGAAEHKALGTVYVTAVILKTGKVKVKGAVGDHLLTQAASDAIQDWRFQPYKIDGQPVDVEVTIPYVFDAKPFVPWPGGIEPPPPAAPANPGA